MPVSFSLVDIADILLVAFVIYRILLLIKGTRAFQVLLGLIIIIVAYVGSKVLGLLTLNWILNTFLSSIILVTVILFQNDIKRGLAHMGRHPLLRGGAANEGGARLDELVRAAIALASRNIGAIIVVERGTDIRQFVEGGVALDANISKDLIHSIFLADSPIHDGAVVVRGPKITLASCLLPLTSRIDLEQELGTRHRAAVGITEETDAVAIVVSEERGTMSLAINGKLTRDLDGVAMRKVLAHLFPDAPPKKKGSRQKARAAEARS
ncbi:TIGR00159 family protein [bacterium]|nr:MAG: TIGR00159 family protein [bacterium]